jgi:hypothetical protein
MSITKTAGVLFALIALAMPATASAHVADIAVDCKGITWSFSKFPEGASTVLLHFAYNGAAETITATIEGPEDSVFRETPAALAESSFHVEASAEWEIEEGAGSAAPVEADLTCEEVKAQTPEKPKKPKKHEVSQPVSPSAGPPASGPSEELPFTGFPAWAWLVIGLSLVGSGIALRRMTREGGSGG